MMKAGPDISMIASLVGDPARANMLTALMSVFAAIVLLYVLKMPYPLIAGLLWIS